MSLNRGQMAITVWVVGISGVVLIAWGIILHVAMGSPTSGELSPVDCFQLGATLLVGVYLYHYLERGGRIGDLNRGLIIDQITALRGEVKLAKELFDRCCKNPTDSVATRNLLSKLKEAGLRISTMDLVLRECNLKLETLSGVPTLVALWIDLRKATTARLPQPPTPDDIRVADLTSQELEALLIRAQIELHHA